MTRQIAGFLLLAGVFATLAAPAEGRERRGPRRAPEHYTFDPGHLGEKLAEYRGVYDRVVLLNESEVEAVSASPLCNLKWTARRVVAWLGEPGDFPGIALRLPRDATVATVELYLIDPNGHEAKKVEEPVFAIAGDTLWVRPPEGIGDSYVIESKAEMTGENLVIHENVHFQEYCPVFHASYAFNVSRDLLQEAVDRGSSWVFRYRTYPDLWSPRRDDTEKCYRWFWRESQLGPIDPRDPKAVARAIEINDYLPVPLLGAYKADELPELDSLQAIERLEEQLRESYREEQEMAGVSYSGGGAAGGEGRRTIGAQTPGKQGGR